MNFTVKPYYIIETPFQGWVDNKIETELNIIAGPFWNEKEALIALIKSQSIHPELKLESKKLILDCRE